MPLNPTTGIAAPARLWTPPTARPQFAGERAVAIRPDLAKRLGRQLAMLESTPVQPEQPWRYAGFEVELSPRDRIEMTRDQVHKGYRIDITRSGEFRSACWDVYLKPNGQLRFIHLMKPEHIYGRSREETCDWVEQLLAPALDAVESQTPEFRSSFMSYNPAGPFPRLFLKLRPNKPGYYLHMESLDTTVHHTNPGTVGAYLTHKAQREQADAQPASLWQRLTRLLGRSQLTASP
jgi:hypothetical protein